MAPRNWQQKEWHWGILFGLLLLAWWLIPSALKSGARRTLQELQAPLWYGSDKWHQVQSYWTLKSQSKEALMRQVVELSRQLSYLELNQSTLSSIPPEEQSATEPMDWQSLDGFRPLYGRVVRRDEKSWWQELTLWRGKVDGIEPNMAVLDGRGLVGRTGEIFAHHCIVELLTDPSFRIVAHLSEDARPVIFEGAFQRGFHRPIGRVTHIPPDISVSPQHPLLLVTSPLSGVYPAGIPIGIITQLEDSANGVFQEGTVHLDDRLLSLREVAIFVPRQQLIPPSLP